MLGLLSVIMPWLEIAEGFQTFEAQDDIEIEQEINEIRALLDEEDEEQS